MKPQEIIVILSAYYLKEEACHYNSISIIHDFFGKDKNSVDKNNLKAQQ